MSDRFAFEIAGRPIPWQRTSSVGGRRVTPQPMRDYKRLIRDRAQMLLPSGWDATGRYQLEVTAVLDSERSLGDWDNYGKIVSDALEGVCYANDRQVWRGTATRLVMPHLPPKLMVEVVADG